MGENVGEKMVLLTSFVCEALSVSDEKCIIRAKGGGWAKWHQ